MAEKNEQTTNVGLENVGDGIDKILETTKVMTTSETSSAVASPEEVNTVVEYIIQIKKLPKTQESYNKVLATAAHLVQIGATSPKFAQSRVISDYGVDVKAGDLKDGCNKADITVRKFARGIRDFTIKVAAKFGIQGNLAKNYKLENPNCDKQDLIWVSDFQTFSENPAMPENVRVWLLQNYRNRFRPDLK